MYTLLISGSRNASPAMLAYAEQVVKRAAALGWAVVCGDAAGVDKCAIEHAEALGVPLTVYGITERPRVPVKGIYKRTYSRSFLDRDWEMVQVCDRMIGIWNGVSRGTLATYRYALTCSKPCDLINFKEES